jgi:nitronate monooxygenase
MFQPLFDATIEAKPPVIALSFGASESYIERAKAAGAKVICQVQSMQHARDAVAGGADVLVAQGNEAGGHTGTMNLLPLLVSVVEAYPDIPVMAAGGISSGRALAAVLAAGAEGAWVGTAFLATPECVEIPEEHKQAIVEATAKIHLYPHL